MYLFYNMCSAVITWALTQKSGRGRGAIDFNSQKYYPIKLGMDHCAIKK